MLRKELQKYLDNLDKIHEKIDDLYKFSNEISKIINKEPSLEELAERDAFGFRCEQIFPEKDNYYEPMMTFKNEDGSLYSFPSRQSITKDYINYWKERTKQSTHPVFVNRYADLVIDFSEKVDREYSLMVINSSVEIVSNRYFSDLDCIKVLKRALYLSVILNDVDSINKTKNCLLDFEYSSATTDMPAFWGLAFEWFLLDKKLNKYLTDEETKNIFDSLVKKYNSFSGNYFNKNHIVMLLAEYYASKNDERNLKSILLDFENDFKNGFSEADPLFKIAHMRQIKDKYLVFQSFPLISKEIKRLSQEIAKMSPEVLGSMNEYSFEIKMPKEEIEKYKDAILGNPPNYAEKDKIINSIVANFFVRKDNEKKQLDSLVKKHPLQFLVNADVFDSEGRLTKSLGGIYEDYDNHLIANAAKNLNFSGIILNIICKELRKNIQPEDIVTLLLDSVTFKGKDKEYIIKALSYFFNNDFLGASHLFIPLIEDGIRNVVQYHGEMVFKYMPATRGYDYITLDKLLEKDCLKYVFGNDYEDVLFYLRLVLTGKYGWNLRNNFAHGIEKSSFFSPYIAERLFHIILLLSLIKNKP